MRADTFTYTDAEGTSIAVYGWLPDTKIRAVVQIVHGMAEHAARYDRFACALTSAGFAVYAADLRGHGKTAGDPARLGILAKKDGYQGLIRDQQELTRRIKIEQPGARVFLFGHSMGTGVVRGLIAVSGAEYAGVILSGAMYPGTAILRAGRTAAAVESRIRGREKPSAFLTRLSFGAYNRPFLPSRTAFDWLSRDTGEVDRYVEDAYCGGVCSAGLFHDLFTGLSWTKRSALKAAMPRDLPMYLFSGAEDPVGARGKAVETLVAIYRKLGLRDVTYKLYPGGRHEMLNETNREEVMRDTIAWMEQRVGQS